jgi:hypothetical protein
MRPLARLLILSGALALYALPERATAGEWLAGVARVKITPDQPLLLSGKYQRDRPAVGTLHDLWAKALALEAAGGRRVVLGRRLHERRHGLRAVATRTSRRRLRRGRFNGLLWSACSLGCAHRGFDVQNVIEQVSSLR